jgi:hypothetical protein
MLFKYLSLPKIPDELLLHNEEDFTEMENIFKNKGSRFYKQHLVTNPELKKFIEDIFGCPCFCTYQVIKNGIPVHKDSGRTECINYLITTGGPDAALDFYNNRFKVEHSEKLPAHVWHWLNVSGLHGVSGLTSTRISISIELRGESNVLAQTSNDSIL